MDEIVQEFLIESKENLDRLDQELVKLESDPSCKELLAGIFRTIHTIKGSCGFLGFTRLQKVTHAGENLLARLRDGQLVLNSEITSGLLAMVDAVRQMLAAIQKTEADGEEDYAVLIERLASLQDGSPALSTLKSSIPESGAQHQQSQADGKEPKEPRRPREEASPARPDAHAAPATAATATSDRSLETVRVGVPLLDRLMNLVGELVLARNQLLQFSNNSQDAEFQALSQRMNLVASDLQEQVMRTRLQPIDTIWSKFPRTVRDLAVSCGKGVRVEMEGQETELDRTIVEAIKDPLTHLLRNAVDHGIESPEVRTMAGKNPVGELCLRASHEGGQVSIEISDDGAGLNLERIRKKAVERGVVPAEQAARLHDRDVVNLIFLPGFSTAEKVSSVSGRGVGLDVVKTNVERIGGTVEAQSIPGQKTAFRIKIPLTLAIIPALVVVSGGERFAVPQVSLLELARVQLGGIEFVGSVPVYRLRGRLLPLIYLDRELGIAREHAGAADSNILVLQAEGNSFGLLVDEIRQTEEIVVKPLGKQLNGIGPFSGATIMGDGGVALILDVGELARRAGLTGESRQNAVLERRGGIGEAEKNAIQPAAASPSPLLLVQCGENRMGIPLSAVARLEEFPRSTVERTASGLVVQYRGHILPLLNLSEVLAMPHMEESAPCSDELVQVVVYTENGSSAGLIVDSIIDLVAETPELQDQPERPGIAGSAIVQDRVIDMLDVPAFIRQAIPGFGKQGIPL